MGWEWQQTNGLRAERLEWDEEGAWRARVWSQAAAQGSEWDTRSTVEHEEWDREYGQRVKHDLGAGLPTSLLGTGWPEAGRIATAVSNQARGCIRLVRRWPWKRKGRSRAGKRRNPGTSLEEKENRLGTTVRWQHGQTGQSEELVWTDGDQLSGHACGLWKANNKTDFSFTPGIL